MLLEKIDLEPHKLVKSMDDVWLSAVTDKITQNVSNKHSWLKLNWERVSVEGEFPRKQGDSDSFSCLILVQKSELKEAIEKLQIISRERYWSGKLCETRQFFGRN